MWDMAKWWKAPEDDILRLPSDGSLKGVSVPDWSIVERIAPWGWDAHIVRLLERLGAPRHLLPTAEELSRWRILSSRQTTVRMLDLLKRNMAGDARFSRVLRAESQWCTTMDEVHAAISGYGGRAILKAPWSCSGRGVWMASATDAPAMLRAEKVMARQGAVEAEPVYDRKADFAMEYECDSRGSVSFEGYSLFATTESGGYQGNVVASQTELAERIAGYGICTTADLQSLSVLVGDGLEELLGKAYRGPLGVDMMLTPQGIHPCIEVNLRLTMGRVAIWQARAFPCALPHSS